MHYLLTTSRQNTVMYNQDASATVGVAMTAKVPPKSTTCQEGGSTKAGLFASAWRGKCHSNHTRGHFLLHN